MATFLSGKKRRECWRKRIGGIGEKKEEEEEEGEDQYLVEREGEDVDEERE